MIQHHRLAAMLLTLAVLVIGTGASAQPLQLAEDGQSRYRIVIAEAFDTETAHASKELVEHLQKVTGARLAVTSEAGGDAHVILLGPSAALDALNLDIDYDALGPEGFVIRTVGSRLVITGGPRRGLLNGVYTFLQDHVGVRWYAPRMSRIPSKSDLQIPELNVQVVPPLVSRCLLANSTTDADWAARNRLNTFTRDMKMATVPEDVGHRLDWDGYIHSPQLIDSYSYAKWHVHSLGHNQLLETAAFADHPEYFGEIHGVRSPEGQPCLTNPDVVEYITRRAYEWLQRYPEAEFITISQGDYGNRCQCEECEAAAKQRGVTTVFFDFVNKVAINIEKRYPDILVDTLAYQWTRKPPTDLKMNKNVVVRYTPIEACYYHPFNKPTTGQWHWDIYGEMDAWRQITPRLWVWYFAIPGDELHPYPNLKALSANFKSMRDHGMTGIFIQGEEGEMCMSGGLTELQAYVIAQLLWNPDYDVEAGIDGFINDCYGAAGPYIKEYVELVNDIETYDYARAGREEKHLRIMDMVPVKQEALQRMAELFEKAQAVVKGDAELLRRVQFVKLSAQYAAILYAPPGSVLHGEAVAEFFPVAELAGVYNLRHAYKGNYGEVQGRAEELAEFQRTVTGE
jgi:hypothetical protein